MCCDLREPLRVCQDQQILVRVSGNDLLDSVDLAARCVEVEVHPLRAVVAHFEVHLCKRSLPETNLQGDRQVSDQRVVIDPRHSLLLEFIELLALLWCERALEPLDQRLLQVCLQLDVARQRLDERAGVLLPGHLLVGVLVWLHDSPLVGPLPERLRNLLGPQPACHSPEALELVACGCGRQGDLVARLERT